MKFGNEYNSVNVNNDNNNGNGTRHATMNNIRPTRAGLEEFTMRQIAENQFNNEMRLRAEQEGRHLRGLADFGLTTSMNEEDHFEAMLADGSFYEVQQPNGLFGLDPQRIIRGYRDEVDRQRREERERRLNERRQRRNPVHYQFE